MFQKVTVENLLLAVGSGSKMKMKIVTCICLVTLCASCTREKSYPYAEALAFQAVSYESERVIAVAGTTNGPFLRATCTVLTSPGQTVSAKSRDGSTISWIRPEGIHGEVRCYSFENKAGKKCLVVKELVDGQSANQAFDQQRLRPSRASALQSRLVGQRSIRLGE